MLATCGYSASPIVLTICILCASSVLAQVKLERVEYGGWPNCIRMSNGTVELIATTDVGPRVIRYGFIDKDNEFYENPKELGVTNAEEWVAFGGHRLWLAPEAKPRSYHPDSKTIEALQKDQSLQLIQPVETENGIQKEILITMAPQGSKVTLNHKLTNHNLWTVELAPWTLTVMAPGGKAIFPQETYSPHPDIPTSPDRRSTRNTICPCGLWCSGRTRTWPTRAGCSPISTSC